MLCKWLLIVANKELVNLEKVNHIQKAEELLWHYEYFLNSIGNLRRRKAHLIAYTAPQGYPSQDFKEDRIKGGGKQYDAYNHLQGIIEVTQEIDRNMENLRMIDSSLKAISQPSGCELYGKVLRLWYIERKDKEEIAAECKKTVRHVYRIKGEAIQKFAINIYGISAIEGQMSKLCH